jgi:hypothetical protein
MTNRSSLQMGIDESEVVFHVAAMFKLWGGFAAAGLDRAPKSVTTGYQDR